MTRPRIDRLLDQTVRVWRAPTGEQSNLGVEQRNYELVATYAAKVNRSAGPTGNIGGGGLGNVGRLRLYMRPDVDVRVRDVLEIIGVTDNDHETYEVDEPPVRPMQHHTQLDCTLWSGILPEVEAS